MKKIIALFVCLITLMGSLVSCKDKNTTNNNEFESIPEYSKDNIRYQYNMDDYVTLPSYEGKEILVELDYIKYQIDNLVFSKSTDEEYAARRGDDLYVTFEFFKVAYDDPDTQKSPKPGEKIDEISESFLLENLYEGNYNKTLEGKLIGLRIGQAVTARMDIPNDFKHSEYVGQSLYVKYKIDSKMTEEGDIINVTYTGYYIDENDKIIMENDKEKSFDSGTTDFFLGSGFAISDFETNLTGVKVGSEVEFFARFPKDYGVADLNGKKVLFKAKVNKLYKKETYDLDFIKAYCGEQYESVEEYENSLIALAGKQNMITYLMESSQIKDYPSLEYRVYEEKLKAIAVQFEEKYKQSYDDYLMQTAGMNRDQYIKSNMVYEMVLYTVAYKAQIKPGEKAIDEAKEELIAYYKQYFMDVNTLLTKEEAEDEAIAYVEEMGYGSVYEQALYKMVEEYLADKYTIKEVPLTK